MLTKSQPLPSPIVARPRRQAQATQKLNELIVDSIQDIKGKRIVVIDMQGLEEAPAQYFILCEAESLVQIRAIAENVRRRARTELGERARNPEGVLVGKWICIDFFETVVHVFSPEAREFYDLESLWGDGRITRIADI